MRVRLKEYSYAHGNRELEFLGNFAVATFSSRHYRIRYVAIKRIFDIVCAIVGMMIFIPMYFIMAIGLFIEGDPGSVIVQTLRVGKNSRRFYMLRFRTLRKKALKPVLGMVYHNIQLWADLLKHWVWKICLMRGTSFGIICLL